MVCVFVGGDRQEGLLYEEVGQAADVLRLVVLEVGLMLSMEGKGFGSGVWVCM
jgi:predicted RNA-binding protein YlxR (DUF448 family)